MTYKPETYYGGADYYNQTFDNETLTIPDRVRTRMWMIREGDVGWRFNFQLPDATKNFLNGFAYYFVYNDTGGGEIDIKDSVGVIVGVIARSEAAWIGLFDRQYPAGIWTVQVSNTGTRRSFDNLGPQDAAAFGGGSDVFRYNYDLDTWSTGTAAPVSLNIVTAAAFNVGTPTGFLTYYRITTAMYTYIADTHTAKTPSTTTAKYTSLSRSAGGLPDGFIHYSDAASSNSVELYAIGADTWSAFLSVPTTQYSDNTCASLLSLNFLCIGKRPSGIPIDNFWRTSTIAGTHVLVAPVPEPDNRWAPCLVALGNYAHLFNGNASSDFPAEFASNFHWQFSNTTSGSWSAQPKSIVRAQGQGVNEVEAIPHRCTFGMGQVDVGGTPGHFQYNSATLAYSIRGSLAWGARSRRENAWAGYQRS